VLISCRKEVIGNATLYLGDCLEILPTLDKVDAVITDIPYGTTQCEWDRVVDSAKLAEEIKKIGAGAFITTSSQPFTSVLISDLIKYYKYSWVWDKGLSGNIFLSKTQPMKIHEDINVFGLNSIKYNPIKTAQAVRKIRNNGMNDSAFGSFGAYAGSETDELNPKTILYFPNTDRKSIQHPTQKPTALYEYLTLTYSDSGYVICDPFMGSGTTGVACMNLGRKFIGIEIEPKYFDIACERIDQAQRQQRMFA